MAKAKTLITLAEGENIPLNQLRLSEDNVRKTFTKEEITDMAADIRSNGLIQSLAVKKLAEPEDSIVAEVIGGGRRFRALQLLVSKKELAEDAPIPTVPNEKQVAAQISLAENVQRQALNPIDEYRAYATMKAQGMTEDDIAAANRVSVHVVKQRLRLGSASPVLHRAFLDEKLALSNLMAFCVTDNQERQEQVWKELKSQSYLNAWTIKQKLMENTVPTSDRRVKFVGLKAYESAGGRVEPDLFAEDHASYVLDVDLLNQLVQAKLDRAAEKVKARGWAWTMTGVDIPYAETSAFGQITAQNEERTEEEEERLQALEAERADIRQTPKDERSKKQVKRLEDLNAEIEAMENPEPIYAPEDMARAGATVEIDSSGKLNVTYGYLKPDEVAEDCGDDTDALAAGDETEEDGVAKLPDSLVTNLTIHRTASLQAALAEKPDVAFVAVIHAMAVTALNMFGSDSCLQVRAVTDFPSQIDGLKEFGPMSAMIEQRKTWAARLPSDSVKLWDAIEAMPRKEQMQLLAFLVASTVNVVVQKHDNRSRQVNHSHVLADALKHDIRKDWKPTAENFFKRVPKAMILASVAEARDEKTANLISHCKKAAMATEAERLLQGTGWIPQPMRAETPVLDDDAQEEDGGLPTFLGDGETEGEEARATA